MPKEKRMKLIVHGRVYRVTIPKKMMEELVEEADRQGKIFAQEFRVFLIKSRWARRSVGRKLEEPFIVLQPVYVEG